MGKNGKKKSSALVVMTSDPALAVRPSVICQRCALLIQKLLSLSGAAFNECTRCKIENSHFFLHSVEASDCIDSAHSNPTEQHPHRVVPLYFDRHRGLGEDQFWLGVMLAFREKPDDVRKRSVIAGASLRVFRGQSSDAAKEMLFRAEWDFWENGTRTSHAQPHWHVHVSPFEKVVKTAARFELSEERAGMFGKFAIEGLPTEGDISKLWATPEKFHYAMASRWHDEGMESHIHMLSEDSLQNWLEGCICYIRTQLTYLSSKTPRK